MKIFYITFSMSQKGWDDDDYNPYAGHFYADIEAESKDAAIAILRYQYDDMDIYILEIC